MMKDVLIVLGNGFPIDFVNFIKKEDQIDLSNLFSNGDKVLWPADDQPGFLSKYRCPALWELGARPNISAMQSSKIIEDIITCANVSASSEHPAINSENTNVYIRAYHELVIYLKYLFIYYNRMICDSDLDNAIAGKWGWSELLNELRHAQFSETPFYRLIEKLASTHVWKSCFEDVLEIDRMEDKEFTSELLILMLEKRILSYTKETLDEYYKKWAELEVGDIEDKYCKVMEYISQMGLDYSSQMKRVIQRQVFIFSARDASNMRALC